MSPNDHVDSRIPGLQILLTTKVDPDDAEAPEEYQQNEPPHVPLPRTVLRKKSRRHKTPVPVPPAPGYRSESDPQAYMAETRIFDDASQEVVPSRQPATYSAWKYFLVGVIAFLSLSIPLLFIVQTSRSPKKPAGEASQQAVAKTPSLEAGARTLPSSTATAMSDCEEVLRIREVVKREAADLQVIQEALARLEAKDYFAALSVLEKIPVKSSQAKRAQLLLKVLARQFRATNLALADKALKNGDCRTARSYLDEILVVSPEDDGILEARKRVDTCPTSE
jgi:hypothetical protein